MCSREGIDLETDILSDSAALHEIIQSMRSFDHSIHCLRDVTRGGLASVLNELAHASQVGIVIDETAIPIQPQVGAVCELLGLESSICCLRRTVCGDCLLGLRRPAVTDYKWTSQFDRRLRHRSS